MVNLTNEYGYYSSGESFSIGDKNEVWVLEMVAKGDFEKGSLWVAKKVPEGHITGHANQARITKIEKNSSDFLYADDIITFAQKNLNYTGAEEDFSF